MSKRTNLDVRDAACLHIVHILQHPTSRPTTKSTQTTIVNAPNKIFSPLPAGKYDKSTKWSTQRHHQANECKPGLEAEGVRAIGALRSLRSKKRLLRPRNDEKHTSSVFKRKENRLRIMLRERLLEHNSDLKMQRQRFSKSRMVQGMLKTPD